MAVKFRPDEGDRWKADVLRDFEMRQDADTVICPPTSCTKPASAFYENLNCTSGILTFSTKTAVFADNAAFVSKMIVDGVKELPKGYDPTMPLQETPGPFQKQLFALSETLQQMILVRLVDNFTTYVSEVIRECLVAKPEILRSKETVTIEYVMQAGSLNELYENLVDRKVNELAYLGFPRLADWLDDRLGIDFLRNFHARAVLIEILETRNCIVHNRSRTSEKLLRAIGKEPARQMLGLPIEVSVEFIYLAMRATAECVKVLDKTMSRKFGLSCLDASANA